MAKVARLARSGRPCGKVVRCYQCGPLRPTTGIQRQSANGPRTGHCDRAKGRDACRLHTAVLAYVGSREQRDRFAAMMRRENAVWISNEAPGLFSFPTAIAPPAP